MPQTDQPPEPKAQPDPASDRLPAADREEYVLPTYERGLFSGRLVRHVDTDEDRALRAQSRYRPAWIK